MHRKRKFTELCKDTLLRSQLHKETARSPHRRHLCKFLGDDSGELAAKASMRCYKRHMRSFLLLFLFCALPAGSVEAASVCGMADDRVRVMLRDLEIGPSLVEESVGFLQVLADEASRVSGFDVLSTEEVREALNQEAEKALMGCTANDCLAEIAEAMDVSLIVGGSVLQAPEGGTLISLFLLNTRAVVVVNRVVMRWQGPANQMTDVLRAAAQTLLLDSEKRPPGALQLVGLPPNARIFVDGREQSASSQAGRVEQLPVGPHEILVEAEEMIPVQRHVVIRAGDLSTLEIRMEPAPPAVPWLVAGTGGALIAGGAVALLVAYLTGQSDVNVSANLTPYDLNDFVAQQKASSAE